MELPSHTLPRITGFGVHAATWCVLLAVLGLFVWLNVEWSRNGYVEHNEHGWRGGTREGMVANSIVIMLLVIGAACASEKYLRRRDAAAGGGQDAG
jgi:hypothetical protein